MRQLKQLEHLDSPEWHSEFVNYLSATGTMIAELRTLDYQVDYALSLPRYGRVYEDAVPILMEWLPKVKNKKYKEDIVRALSVPWAGAALPLLFSELDLAGPDSGEVKQIGGYRWATANAICVLANDSVYEDIKRRALDEAYGLSRSPLLEALAKTKLHKDEVAKISLKVLQKGEKILLGSALNNIRTLKYIAAKSDVEKVFFNEDPYMRNLAKRTYKVLETAGKQATAG